MPTGQVFFLSKKTGKIDVVRTNLDGSDRKTIVKGTGKERDNETSLLASRDWRYLALLANRDGGTASLYLIDTKTNAMTLIDEGKDISTTLIGWSGHQFWYEIDRNNDYWTAKQEALKTLNADSKQLKIVDEDKSVGSEEVGAYETLDNFYIQEQGVVYTKIWNTSLLPEEYVGDDAKLLAGKNHTINLATADGTKLSTLKSFSLKSPNYLGQAKLYEPRELYFQLTNDNGKNSYIEYENGQILDASVTDNEFDSSYPTFLVSPTGKKTFWSEPRDGKNALFVGDAFGKNKTQLASGSEFKAYGWFTDGNLLLQKSDSELYISTPEAMKTGDAPIKISDYHKPDLNYAGYGYGYGGL